MTVKREHKQAKKSGSSWDAVAQWYDGWMGKQGSVHHRELAIPALLALLKPQPQECLLDVGAGQGVLAPYVIEQGVSYLGLDASKKLIAQARRYHRNGRFLVGDARRLQRVEGLHKESMDTAVFLLSIQDMDPLAEVLRSVSWVLKPNGRLVIVMTHPCFRIPRQSGWGWDQGRKLRYRRVDSYLSPLQVPMTGNGRRQKTRSYHRPLQAYINGLAECGLMIDQIQEIPVNQVITQKLGNKADKRANDEIPLFLGIRANKVKK